MYWALYSTRDTDIKNLLPTFKGITIQWGHETITLWSLGMSIKRKNQCVLAEESSAKALRPQSVCVQGAAIFSVFSVTHQASVYVKVRRKKVCMAYVGYLEEANSFRK